MQIVIKGRKYDVDRVDEPPVAPVFAYSLKDSDGSVLHEWKSSESFTQACVGATEWLQEHDEPPTA